jgi:hypothetical protein
MRRRQQEYLQQEVRSIVTLLLGRRPLPSLIEQVLRDFDEIVKYECNTEPSKWKDPPESAAHRRRLNRIVGWTDHFHPALLREFSCIDLINRNKGPSLAMESLWSRSWYFPAVAKPGWVAWSVLLELALRRLLTFAADGRLESDGYKTATSFYPVECRQPTILFYREPRQQGEPNPAALVDALTIQTNSYSPRNQVAPIRGVPARRTVWNIPPTRAPWPKPIEGGSTANGKRYQRPFFRFSRVVPSAEEIWRMATNDSGFFDSPDLGSYLGTDKKETAL